MSSHQFQDSSTSTGSKRKKSDQSPTQNEPTPRETFWDIALGIFETIGRQIVHEDGPSSNHDGLHHWTLYVESELRAIDDVGKLRRAQKLIVNVLDHARDPSFMTDTQEYSNY